MEMQPSVELSRQAESFISNPPGLILVFDNFRGVSAKKKSLAELTMHLRAQVASLVYFSDCYKDKDKPFLCCFAGEHEKDGIAGSKRVKEHLLSFGIPEEKIITSQTTITTRTDITKLHSVAKARHINSPLAIVTTDDHVKRTKSEVDNHFSYHVKKHGPNYPIPQIYILSPMSEELKQLTIDGRRPMEIVQQVEFDHGYGEKLATILAKYPILRIFQPLAEKTTHPYTPIRLKRIQKILKKFK